MWPNQKAFKRNPLKLKDDVLSDKSLTGKQRYWKKRANNVRPIKVVYKRLTPKKVFIAKGNIKHTTSKVIVTLLTYNVSKLQLLRKIREAIYKTFLTTIKLCKFSSLVEDKTSIRPSESAIVKLDKKKKDRKERTTYPSKFIKIVKNYKIKIKIVSLFNRRLTLDEYLNSSYEYLSIDLPDPYKVIPRKHFITKLNLLPPAFINKVEKLKLNKNNDYPLKDNNSYLKLMDFTYLNIKKVSERLNIILNYYKHLTVLVENKILNDNEKLLIFLSKTNKFNVYKYRNISRFVLTKFKEKKMYLAGLLRFAWLLYVNDAKFKNPVLVSKLKYLVKNLYDKEVEFNIVELKKFHLTSDIYTQLVAKKLKNRDNKLYRVLRWSLMRANLPNVSRAMEKYSEFNKDKYLANKIRNQHVNSMFTDNNSKIDSLNNLLLNLFPKTSQLTKEIKKITERFIYPTSLQDYVIDNIKHGKLAGIRVETKGRLTKRFTAQRSVYKMHYKGGLRNVDSSFKGLPAVLLRGFLKTNVEYSIVQSKNRNGAYGVKGWVGSK